jgi:hypothetical protein
VAVRIEVPQVKLRSEESELSLAFEGTSMLQLEEVEELAIPLSECLLKNLQG